MNGSLVTVTPEALSLLRGARVLARRDTDSLYYLGHIACEVEGSCDRFLVEFEKCRSPKGKGQFRMQETSVCDIIHYEDARWRPLVPGDHVLAPVDGNMDKYGPGTVLQGGESRICGLASDSNGVLVTFWNGKTKQVAPGLAIWIPQRLSDRITLELHVPLEARKKLMESCPGFPFIGSANTHPVCTAKEKVGGPGSHTCLYCSPSGGTCQTCYVPEELWAALRNSLSHVSQMTSSKEKPSKKVAKDQVPTKDIASKEKNKRQSKIIRDQRAHQGGDQIGRHKDHMVCSRDTQTDRTSGPYTPIKSNVKAAQGDPMKSSNKTSTSLDNMTHLQATLHRIDKAMKEDRLAMESAILERTPLRLNAEPRAPKYQERRERKEVGQAEVWRIQEEERKKRRKEKTWEMEQRELMLQDSRLCSEQRILLDLERRQDREGLEVQQAESRRGHRKEENMEREYRNEGQRVQFHGDLQQQRDDLALGKRRKQPKQKEKKDKHKDLVQNRVMVQQEEDLQDWRRHQQLQTGSVHRVSKRLEQFYHQAEKESKPDTDLQQYLKEHNLQALRSVMVL
ncbi:trichohyalin-like isoform X2 [Pseudophryne corroboree]